MASSSPLDDFGDRVEHLPVLFAVHKSLYGGKGDDLHSTFVPSETDVTSMVALCYELDAVYENPVLSFYNRPAITDAFLLSRYASMLQLPRLRTLTSRLSRKLASCVGFKPQPPVKEPEGIRLVSVWSEIGDIAESESFDGSHLGILSHTLHVAFLPSIFAVHPSSAAGSHSLLHLSFRLLTFLQFNESGRITFHRDHLDVRDLFEGFIPFAAISGLIGRWLGGVVMRLIAAACLKGAGHDHGRRSAAEGDAVVFPSSRSPSPYARDALFSGEIIETLLEAARERSGAGGDSNVLWRSTPFGGRGSSPLTSPTTTVPPHQAPFYFHSGSTNESSAASSTFSSHVLPGGPSTSPQASRTGPTPPLLSFSQLKALSSASLASQNQPQQPPSLSSGGLPVTPPRPTVLRRRTYSRSWGAGSLGPLSTSSLAGVTDATGAATDPDANMLGLSEVGGGGQGTRFAGGGRISRAAESAPDVDRDAGEWWEEDD